MFNRNLISEFVCSFIPCKEDITYLIIIFGISVSGILFNNKIISRNLLIFIVTINILLVLLPDYGDYVVPGRREALLAFNFIFICVSALINSFYGNSKNK